MLCTTRLLALSLLPVAFAQISDNFEEGWNQSEWPIYAPDCNQGGSVTLDTTMGHSGTNSMMVTGGSSGYCGHIFFGTTQVPAGGNVYVRVWVQALNALGSDHVTFITMPDLSQTSGDDLRMGGQDQILMYNRQQDDATLPDMSPQGTATSVALPTGSWQCLEYFLSSNGTMETWLNGAAIAGMTVGPGITNPNANGWGSSYKPDITGVYFGWEAYSGTINTFWYDDIIIASTRAGCSALSSGGTTTGGSSSSAVGSSSPPTTTTTTTTTSSATTPVTTTTSSSTTTRPTTTTTTTHTTTTTTHTTTTTGSTGGTQTLYGQCGGIGYSGPTACAAPATCTSLNAYYSQCLG